MSGRLADNIRDELNRALREGERDTAILTGLPRPESFVYFDYDESKAEAERLAFIAAWPWEEPIPYVIPPPMQYNPIVLQVSTHYAVAMGLIEPPEGYVPWTPPPVPWPRRMRGRWTRFTHRLRIGLANRLAGFDVEDRY